MAGRGLLGLGNNTLTQIALYQLVGQLLGAVLTPYAQAITNQVMQANPLVPLSPAELALAVERGEISEGDAAHQAAMSGINTERFHLLTRLAGQAPAPGDLAEALRRGIIDRATFDRGIVQGAMRAEWADLVRELSMRNPPPEAMLGAYLEGQLPEAEARERFAKLGGNPDYFDILYNSQGQAPTPTEAMELANRGVIPWEGTGPKSVSFQQAFLEGPWRNKWLTPFRALAEYLPPPRTVTAMFKEGSIDHARAAELLAKQGLAPDLAAAYLESGSNQKTAASRDLAQTTILELYRDRLIERPAAVDMLTGLGYDATEADFVLAIEDTRLAQRFLNLAVGRIHTLYVGHKLDRQATVNVLAQLGVIGQGASDLVAIWDWERAANVHVLTPADIRAAFHWKIIALADAQARLLELGMTPYDAWLYLSIAEHAAVGDAPPADALGPAPGP